MRRHAGKGRHAWPGRGGGGEGGDKIREQEDGEEGKGMWITSVMEGLITIKCRLRKYWRGCVKAR